MESLLISARYTVAYRDGGDGVMVFQAGFNTCISRLRACPVGPVHVRCAGHGWCRLVRQRFPIDIGGVTGWDVGLFVNYTRINNRALPLRIINPIALAVAATFVDGPVDVGNFCTGK